MKTLEGSLARKEVPFGITVKNLVRIIKKFKPAFKQILIELKILTKETFSPQGRVTKSVKDQQKHLTLTI